jgi:hypothetical protein
MFPLQAGAGHVDSNGEKNETYQHFGGEAA